MKRSSFISSIVALGLATVAVPAMGQPASAAAAPPGYEARPGMMGGYGGGPGSNRFAAVVSRLGLTADQQQKIAKIHEDTRQKNWEAMGQLLSGQFALKNLYLADKLDANAIVEQQRKVDELRRVMIKSHVEMEIQIEAMLTTAQREQLRSTMPWQMH